MPHIYYPSLNAFWPAVRARNFVKLLGQKPGNYEKNMVILAAKAGVAPEEMWRVNPLKLGASFHKDMLLRTLGKYTYAHLEKSVCWVPIPAIPTPPPAAPAPPSADFLFDMGIQCERGICVEKNMAEAVRYYILAAEKGHAGAQCSLGFCYANGTGVTKNVTEAVRYYTLSAKAGYPQAQYNLAYSYEHGLGVKKDLAAALRYYMIAAEAGLLVAQCWLGTCYELGTGVTRDAAAAVRWYTKAAEAGQVDAQYGLGRCYDLGKGVAKNKVAAVRWYKKAAEAGHAKAKIRHHILAPPAGAVVVNLGCCGFTMWF